MASSCRPPAAEAGIRTITLTAPAALAVDDASSTGVECSHTLTGSLGRNPLPVNDTEPPASTLRAESVAVDVPPVTGPPPEPPEPPEGAGTATIWPYPGRP